MKIPPDMQHLKGFRYTREIIAYAFWVYHRFALSMADVEDLLAERGVFVSREAVLLWGNRFGAYFAQCVRRDRTISGIRVKSTLRSVARSTDCGAPLMRKAVCLISLFKRSVTLRLQSSFFEV